MKYIIKESHVDSLLRVFSNFINSESYEGVCNNTIDYDNEMSRFVINIFFDRKHLIDLGNKTPSYLKRIVNDVAEKFLSFTGHKPLLYSHYDDC